MSLTLYRRHRKDCDRKHPQNHRVFKPTSKSERATDCDCPINAEGSLRVAGLITNRSTKKVEWDEAEAVARHWEEWGQLTPPADRQAEFVTIQYAVDSYLQSHGPTGKNVGESTFNGISILLKQRLMPYAQAHGYIYLREFDNLDVTTKFFESWRNLQPTRNRKGVPLPTAPVPLKDRTKKTELDRLRAFMEYCVKRDWLSENHAKDIRMSVKTDKKFGMDVAEERRFFERIDTHCSDGRGGNGGYNSKQLRAFCLVMRYAGLRLSDATALHEGQLVQRISGKGWAIRVFQKKTEEWVQVPIPEWVAAELKALPFCGEKDGLRLWFWSGKSKLKTTEDNWYRRIMKIVKAVEQTQKFKHRVTPHVFRHTFSIRHLNAGTNIKFVAGWLGHRSVSVTEKHYLHAVMETQLASEDAYDASLRRQEAMAAGASSSGA